MIDKVLLSVLINKEEQLSLASRKVNILLAECARDKVQPSKDYWHDKIKLENEVKALKLLLETTK